MEENPSDVQTIIQTEPGEKPRPYLKFILIAFIPLFLLGAAILPWYFLTGGKQQFDPAILMFWQKPELTQDQNQYKSSDWTSDKQLVRDNTPRQTTQVLEVTFQYDLKAAPALKIVSFRVNNAYPPDVVKEGSYQLKALDGKNNVLAETKFSIPNKLSVTAPAGGSKPGEVVLEKGGFVVGVPFTQSITSIQVMDVQGSVIDSKNIVEIISQDNEVSSLADLLIGFFAKIGVKKVFAATGAPPVRKCIPALGWGAGNKTLYYTCCSRQVMDAEALSSKLTQAGYSGRYNAFEAMNLYEEKYCPGQTIIPPVVASTALTGTYDLCGVVMDIKDVKQKVIDLGWTSVPDNENDILNAYTKFHTCKTSRRIPAGSQVSTQQPGTPPQVKASPASPAVPAPSLPAQGFVAAPQIKPLIDLCAQTPKFVQLTEEKLKTELEDAGYSGPKDKNTLIFEYEKLNCPEQPKAPPAGIAAPVSNTQPNQPVPAPSVDSPAQDAVPSPAQNIAPKTDQSNKCGPIKSITINGEERDSITLKSEQGAQRIEIIVTCQNGVQKRQILNLRSQPKAASCSQDSDFEFAGCKADTCGWDVFKCKTDQNNIKEKENPGGDCAKPEYNEKCKQGGVSVQDTQEPSQSSCNWEFLRNECTGCNTARTVEKDCNGNTRIAQEGVSDSGCGWACP